MYNIEYSRVEISQASGIMIELSGMKDEDRREDSYPPPRPPPLVWGKTDSFLRSISISNHTSEDSFSTLTLI